MTVRRRLLLVRGGSGSFTAPPQPAAFDLTSAPSGGWINAVYSPDADVTFIVYPEGGTGDIEVIEYDHANETVSGPYVIAAAVEQDAHTAPYILIRSSDKRLMVWYSLHDGAPLYQAISTNPLDASAWGSPVNLDSQLGGSQYTYPLVVERVSTGQLTLHFRDRFSGDGVLCQSVSMDGGATWSTRSQFVHAGDAVYFGLVSSDGGERIDYLIGSGHPFTANVGVYHFYGDAAAAAYKRTDGTLIGIDYPYVPEDDLTEVYDGADGSASLWSLEMDGTTPVCGYDVMVSPDPTEDYEYRRAKWNGSAWVEKVIADAGAGINHQPFAAPTQPPGFRLYRGDPDVVYASLEVSGTYEMHRLVTADDGDTWSSTQLTFDSPDNQILPHGIIDGDPSLRMLWLYGTYTDYEDYSLGIRGART